MGGVTNNSSTFSGGAMTSSAFDFYAGSLVPGYDLFNSVNQASSGNLSALFNSSLPASPSFISTASNLPSYTASYNLSPSFTSSYNLANTQLGVPTFLSNYTVNDDNVLQVSTRDENPYIYQNYFDNEIIPSFDFELSSDDLLVNGEIPNTLVTDDFIGAALFGNDLPDKTVKDVRQTFAESIASNVGEMYDIRQQALEERYRAVIDLKKQIDNYTGDTDSEDYRILQNRFSASAASYNTFLEEKNDLVTGKQQLPLIIEQMALTNPLLAAKYISKDVAEIPVPPGAEDISSSVVTGYNFDVKGFITGTQESLMATFDKVKDSNLLTYDQQMSLSASSVSLAAASAGAVTEPTPENLRAFNDSKTAFNKSLTDSVNRAIIEKYDLPGVENGVISSLTYDDYDKNTTNNLKKAIAELKDLGLPLASDSVASLNGLLEISQQYDAGNKIKNDTLNELTTFSKSLLPDPSTVNGDDPIRDVSSLALEYRKIEKSAAREIDDILDRAFDEKWNQKEIRTAIDSLIDDYERTMSSYRKAFGKEIVRKGFFKNQSRDGLNDEYNWGNWFALAGLALSIYQAGPGKKKDLEDQMELQMKLERFRTDEKLRLYGGQLSLRDQYSGGGGGGGGTATTAGSSALASVTAQGGLGARPN